ncbi:uncharacterized protein ASCRUDRAFT_80899 [Ascoidea rubescens DSM 1968]|uniref:Uncharacterized protein n=1 Tax=Ascoidea rubescens DSM 1968 TaxID=1344418 RepID=A0A1D2VHM0_9ASCO|nr:hypothetical protein ASCRUDRAFT_80899 [Ascoidea rubescens DSM 1968]ODV61154.1 hypothetical protein ASCRUDRAFT_80899 [Ascoidea rubescens DSM 1968]
MRCDWPDSKTSTKVGSILLRCTRAKQNHTSSIGISYSSFSGEKQISAPEFVFAPVFANTLLPCNKSDGLVIRSIS